MSEPDRVVHIGAADFVRTADQLASRYPDATELVLRNGSGDLPAIARMAALSKYRDLSFLDTSLSEDDATALAGSPWLDELESLDARDTHLTDGCVRALLTGTAYPRLRLLDVSSTGRGQWFGLDSVRVLPRTGFAATLEHVELGGCRLSDGVLDVLAELPRLIGVGLRNNALTAAGVTGWLRDPIVTRLETLDLSDNALGDEAVIALASADCRRLRSLDLAGTGLGHAATVALANAPSLAGLGSLNLANNRLSDPGALALARSPSLAKLAWLTVNATTLGDPAIEALRSRFGDGLRLAYPWS